jgi:hypothetical protein
LTIASLDEPLWVTAVNAIRDRRRRRRSMSAFADKFAILGPVSGMPYNKIGRHNAAARQI